MSITGLMAEADGVKVAPSCGDGPLAKVRNDPKSSFKLFALFWGEESLLQ